MIRFRTFSIGLFLVVIIWVCTACAEKLYYELESFLENGHDDTLPAFIEDVTYVIEPNPNTKLRTCIILNALAVWEGGNLAEPLLEHIKDTTEIFIDEQPIDRLAFAGLDMEFPVRDSNDNISGTYPTGVAVCFNVSEISQGEHTAIIELESMSGNIFTYTWTFTY
jgi:hypothetical protein